jgi:hypothetical protein
MRSCLPAVHAHLFMRLTMCACCTEMHVLVGAQKIACSHCWGQHSRNCILHHTLNVFFVFARLSDKSLEWLSLAGHARVCLLPLDAALVVWALACLQVAAILLWQVAEAQPH